MNRYLIIFIVGVLIGSGLTRWIFWPEITETVRTVETIKTDTLYQTYRDTIRIERERIQEVYVRDTVIKTVRLPINRFSGLEPTLFGDISYTGLVAGHFLKMELNTNFKVPELTHRIERETTSTKVIKKRGLYFGGSVSDAVQWSVGASYLDNLWLFDYRYDIGIKSHSVGLKRKIW